MTTTTTHEPRVWLGCLACYNNGRLLGEWMDPADAAEEDGSTWQHIPDFSPHEELWVMDAEYVPVTGEFGIDTCRQIAEAQEVVDESQWGAFCAYSKHVGGDLDPQRFEEAYVGHYDDFRDYSDGWAAEQIEMIVGSYEPSHGLSGHDKTGLEWLCQNFNYEGYARTLEMEMTVLETPHYETGVYVFRDL